MENTIQTAEDDSTTTEENLLYKELFEDLILLDKNNEQVQSTTALEGKVVALYFSASWSPPCKDFTPVLAETYEELKKRQSPFEVVFISCDKTAEQMETYRQRMHGSWLAVPFDSDKIEKFREVYDISSVPRLIIINGNKEVISALGRKEIQDRGVSAFRSWEHICKMNLDQSKTSQKNKIQEDFSSEDIETDF